MSYQNLLNQTISIGLAPLGKYAHPSRDAGPVIFNGY